jgi:hypothetical protein
MIRIGLLLALLSLAACAGVEPLPMPTGPWVQLNTNLPPPPAPLVPVSSTGRALSRQESGQ